MLQAIDQAGILSGIQNIPHFRLAPLAVFIDQGKFIGGMDLDGQILFGINEFDQNGQGTFSGVSGSQVFRMGCNHISQALPLKHSARHEAQTVGMGGAFPGFRQRRKLYSFFKFVI